MALLSVISPSFHLRYGLAVFFWLLFAGVAAAETSTILSLHNSKTSLTVLNAVNVTSLRMIVESDNILNVNLAKLQSLHDSGVRVLLSVRYREVPVDADAALANFSVFASNVGPLIHTLILGNEPDSEYDSASKETNPATGTIYAMEWIKELAIAADTVRRSSSSTAVGDDPDPALAFLIANPEPNIRYNTVNGWSCSNADGWPAQLLKVGADGASNGTIDLQDVHLHMPDMTTLQKAVKKVQACTTNVQLLSTEWSQAPIVSTSGWLKDNCELNSSITNGDFINSCYHFPVSQDTWSAFVSTAPYNASFMGETMNFFQSEGFAAAA